MITGPSDGDGMIYTTIDQYIDSCSSLQSKIDALDAILLSMLTMIGKAVGTGQFETYKFDDGQTKVETTYRSVAELQKAYQGFDFVRESLIARLNNNRQGRIVRAVPNKNFIGPRNYGW